MRARPLGVLVTAGAISLAGMAVAGCSGGSDALTGSTAPRGTFATEQPPEQPPKPAGVLPSPISKQICSRDAQIEMASALGEEAQVSTPTWVDHLYSCTYDYATSTPAGSFAVSVKELSSTAETTAYFEGLSSTMGRSRELNALGEGAFQTTNGSVVVRKDWKVLLVDNAGLPAQFGVPPTSSGSVAVTVADVILGCWAGD